MTEDMLEKYYGLNAKLSKEGPVVLDSNRSIIKGSIVLGKPGPSKHFIYEAKEMILYEPDQ